MPILNAQNLDESTLADFDLIYVEHDKFTIHRHKNGDGFHFTNQNNKKISDKNMLERLQAIAVPPTYKDVIYCEEVNGHLQAVGVDSNDNKQYFYHENWEHLRSITKFTALKAFGGKIPSFRRSITKLIKADNGHDRVMATMFRILDKTGMRVGGKSSAKANNTYGLTTLRKKHMHVDGAHSHFDYTAKGGVDVSVDITDKAVANILEDCEDIGGQRLFEYEDEDGKIQSISSHHLNSFLKSHMGKDYSVKDFRTWRFSCLFLKMLLKQLQHDKKITLKLLLDQTSEVTGNTPSILQSSYIHPGLIDIAKNHDDLKHHLDEKSSHRGLRANEAIFLKYLSTKHAAQSLQN